MQSISLWLARDMGGSGLYSLWSGQEPEIDPNGYYKYSSDGYSDFSILLLTIHPSKLPWEELSLDRGDCIHLALSPVDFETNIISEENHNVSDVQQSDLGGQHSI